VRARGEVAAARAAQHDVRAGDRAAIAIIDHAAGDGDRRERGDRRYYAPRGVRRVRLLGRGRGGLGEAGGRLHGG
jgi:hypothetical protein